MSLKEKIQEDMKAAMRARDSERLSTIRMLLAAIKQREVDERAELDDAGVLAAVDKMVKQRRDSIAQYEQAGREELAAAEQAEIDILQAYLPKPLTEAELDELVEEAVAQTGAEGMGDMGKVMGVLKPKVQGRADMGQISDKVKNKLEDKR